ncbi:class I SAM-dependent methyltransferase [Sansalvadorimonas sp. 2012CJ34-2]|uniref:Class I SAM-dependent methyltransferase n=1 Tax=Parendozoicomonas callyspongiae TaxID=2942213 RepID=A0ABT0PG98_9GAMM|nr:class I SAM-dependent methyltransferase [Sansalvadorimonas sp. 2012CJ34-2]MCL6270410.1 class I SAM-dependent methyltransferase [Sansalvadorimonas sp. 2012CJ34-2]
MTKWDERYKAEEYIYGKEPNDFLRQHYQVIPKGKVLCLAEGEGRNAVFLASQGYTVTAVDNSSVGLKKAKEFAAEKGVSIDFIHADLAEYDIGSNQWDGIVSIFCHLPKPLRKDAHSKVVQGLKSNGIFLLEAYTPAQLEFGTGGPPTEDLLMTADALDQDLTGLQFLHLQETEREVVEGTYHTGHAAIVQVLAKKP